MIDNINISFRPWEPQDLIDDLQQVIDEEPDIYPNHRYVTLCEARDYLKTFFKELEDKSCVGCMWSYGRRPQKCSCCRRNHFLKDCFESDGKT